jgi:WD40 repeat protein
VVSTDRLHGQGIAVMALSPDGKTLATAGVDQTIKFWDVSEWKK